MSKPSTVVVEVAIALIWRGKRLLITRRPAQMHLGGLWEFPGGKREPYETFATCAEREALEEVGVRVRAERERTRIEHDYGERSVKLVVLDCSWLEGEPECREVSEFAWVTPRELCRYAFPEANASLLGSLVEAEKSE